jgi:hypothetical protein
VTFSDNKIGGQAPTDYQLQREILQHSKVIIVRQEDHGPNFPSSIELKVRGKSPA